MVDTPRAARRRRRRARHYRATSRRTLPFEKRVSTSAASSPRPFYDSRVATRCRARRLFAISREDFGIFGLCHELRDTAFGRSRGSLGSPGMRAGRRAVTFVFESAPVSASRLCRGPRESAPRAPSESRDYMRALIISLRFVLRLFDTWQQMPLMPPR